MKTVSDPAGEVWNISRLMGWTTDYFISHHIDSPRMTAEILLAHSLSISRIDLYLQYDKPLNSEELSNFKALVKRRVNREPVAYIIGTKGFWNLDLEVNAHVLIPRPDTECLVEKALEVIPPSDDNPPLTVLDLGTGSGAILLALASERPHHMYVGVDVSFQAVRVAENNKNKLLPDRCVRFVTGNWFDMFQPVRLFDVVVSNPPYIPKKDIDGLEPEVSAHEPRLALDGDDDGLFCLRHIVKTAPGYVKKGGYLLMEMGFDQQEGVRELFASYPCYEHVEFFKDYAGNDRVVKARVV